MAGRLTGDAPVRASACADGPARRVFNLAALALLVALAPARALAGDPLRIVVLGDSLAAGYGLLPDEGFSARLQDWADAAADVPVIVENAGVSGDTTAGGLARLDWTLGADPPDAVIVELGANDALRGIEPAETRANLAAILKRLTEQDVAVLLAGMLAPRNMGADYVAEFEAGYPDLAEAFDVVYLPFLLEGVAGDPALNQADGIHPNPEGVERMIAHVAPSMRELLDRIAP